MGGEGGDGLRKMATNFEPLAQQAKPRRIEVSRGARDRATIEGTARVGCLAVKSFNRSMHPSSGKNLVPPATSSQDSPHA